MRLTDENIRYFRKCHKSGGTLHYHVIDHLFDTIQDLQQENERLKGAMQEWIDGVCISQKYLSQIGKLQQENERLQVQNGAMREALEQVQHDIDGAECRDDLDGIKGYIDGALAAIDKVIGGREDV